MQGDPEVIEFLNEQLTAELTAINQYFLHAKMQENFGWTKLAEVHAARVLRRDEARGGAHRPDPLPGRPAELPAALPRPGRPDGHGDVRGRPAGRGRGDRPPPARASR